MPNVVWLRCSDEHEVVHDGLMELHNIHDNIRHLKQGLPKLRSASNFQDDFELTLLHSGKIDSYCARRESSDFK